MLKSSKQSAGGSAAQVPLRHVTNGKAVARMQRSEIRDHRCRFEVVPGLRCASSGLRKQTKKHRKQNADRRNAVICRALRARPRPRYGRRTSIGVPPRFSPRGRVVVLGSASGHASWDVAAFVRRVLPVPACRMTRRGSEVYVSKRVTIVNGNETNNFRAG